MSLLVPLALFGLLTIPAILLLHLLRSRRQQLPVPGLWLWRGLEQHRRGGLPRSIPLTLTLLLQLIAAAALSLALARPVQSFLLSPPRQTVFILDTTTSMLAEDAAGGSRRFEIARQAIRQAIGAMRDEDTFAIVGLNDTPSVLLSGLGAQKTEALRRLDSLIPGATGADLFAALTLADTLLRPNEFDAQILILTDAAFTPPDDPLPPVSAAVTWRTIPPVPSAAQNLALLNVSTTALPDGRHRVMARLVNFGDAPTRRTLRLSAGGKMLLDTPIQLDPRGEHLHFWNLPAQTRTVVVEIVEPDALPLDNRAELWLTPVAGRRVLLLSNTPDPLERALQAQPDVSLAVFPLDYTGYNPTEFDLLVFDGLPPNLTAWPPGNVWVINPQDGPLLNVQESLAGLRAAETGDSPLLASVDLSGVYFGRVQRVVLPEWAEVDLWAAGADEATVPLIFHGAAGDARVLVWAFDLHQSNLAGRLALPLLTANTLSALLTPAPPSVALLGRPVILDGPLTVELPGGRRQSVDGEKGKRVIFRQTHQPGLYTLYDALDRPVGGFAVHAGAALESDLSRHLTPDVFKLTVQAVDGPSPEVVYEEFWPWLAGVALLAVLAEGWLAWRR